MSALSASGRSDSNAADDGSGSQYVATQQLSQARRAVEASDDEDSDSDGEMDARLAALAGVINGRLTVAPASSSSSAGPPNARPSSPSAMSSSSTQAAAAKRKRAGDQTSDAMVEEAKQNDDSESGAPNKRARKQTEQEEEQSSQTAAAASASSSVHPSVVNASASELVAHPDASNTVAAESSGRVTTHANSTTDASMRDAGSWVPEVVMKDADEEKAEPLPKDSKTQEPQPPAAASAHAAANPTAAISPASALYNDAVQSVLSFLPLADLSRCMSVSSQWRSVVLRMASLQRDHCIFDMTTGRALTRVCSSSLARHIGDLFLSGEVGYNFNAEQLKRIAQDMAFLSLLQCTLTSRLGHPFLFPQRLTSLNLDVRFSSNQGTQAVMVGIGAIASLERLTLRIDTTHHTKRAKPEEGDRLFAPLLQLQNLSSFKFHIYRTAKEKRINPRFFLAADIDCLRRMPALTRLSLLHANPNSDEPLQMLTDLTAQPHTLKLRDIHLTTSSVEDDTLVALSRLPSLTRLTPLQFFVSDMSPLGLLVNLTELNFHLADISGNQGIDGDAVIAALRPLTQLTHLDMAGVRLAPIHLRALMHGELHPAMRFLELEGLSDDCEPWRCVSAVWPPALHHLCLAGPRFRLDALRRPLSRGSTLLFRATSSTPVLQPACDHLLRGMSPLTELTLCLPTLSLKQVSSAMQIHPHLRTLTAEALSAADAVACWARAPASLTELNSNGVKIKMSSDGRTLRLIFNAAADSGLVIEALTHRSQVTVLNVQTPALHSTTALASYLASHCPGMRALTLGDLPREITNERFEFLQLLPPLITHVQLTAATSDSPSAAKKIVLLKRTGQSSDRGNGSRSCSSSLEPLAGDSEMIVNLRQQYHAGLAHSLAPYLNKCSRLTSLELQEAEQVDKYVAALLAPGILPHLRRLCLPQVDEIEALRCLQRAVRLPSLELRVSDFRNKCFLRLYSIEAASIEGSLGSRSSRGLDLSLSRGFPGAAMWQQLGADLSELTLQLSHEQTTNVQLAQILSPLIKLEKLTLRDMTTLKSLRCLASALLPRLTHLQLLGAMPLLSTVELRHLRKLSHLTHLTIQHCFSQSLDDYTLFLHTPPSLLVPSLQHFLYSPSWAKADMDAHDQLRKLERLSYARPAILQLAFLDAPTGDNQDDAKKAAAAAAELEPESFSSDDEEEEEDEDEEDEGNEDEGSDLSDSDDELED